MRTTRSAAIAGIALAASAGIMMAGAIDPPSPARNAEPPDPLPERRRRKDRPLEPSTNMLAEDRADPSAAALEERRRRATRAALAGEAAMDRANAKRAERAKKRLKAREAGGHGR